MLSTADVISKVVEETGLSGKDAKLAVDATLAAIVAMTSAEPVVMRGFGTFSRKERPARSERQGVNPRTGVKIAIPAQPSKTVLHLKVSSKALS